MTEKQFTDEQLMAFADGLADPQDTAAIEAAVANDAALAGRVDMFRQTTVHLSELAAARIVDVPEALEAKVREMAMASDAENDTKVVEFAQMRAQSRPSWYQMPLAASLFLAIGVAGTYFVLQPAIGTNTADLQVAGLNHPSVKSALNGLPSGARQPTTDGGEVALIASFTNADGEICREFELDHPDRQAIVSVACHDSAGWNVRLAIAAAPVAETGYAPASSLETLDAYLSATQASAPMEAEAEIEALKQLSN
ncbi:MAG: hypothetical protein AAFW87_13355 [Pseudomonadota bacterium]